jgi:hypothetical protein
MNMMPATFSDDPIFAATAVVCTILFLIFLGTFLHLMPALMNGVIRWKGNLELEDSLQLSKSRNIIAAILYIPVVMIFYHFGIFRPAFLDSIPSLWRFPVVVGIFMAYLLLRWFLNWQIELQNFSSKTFTAANNCFFSFTIILFLALFIVIIIMKPFTNNDHVTSIVLTIAFFAFYCFHIYRRGQIFASVCNPLTTFLYLCTLEIIPTGMMVITTTML